MEALRVGRSTVREVIRHWLALGIVEVRKGSGTFLKRPVSSNTVYLPLAIVAERDALLQTLDVRRGLEVEASALAAQRARPGRHRDHGGRGLPRWSVSPRRRAPPGREDLAFHLSIYDASHNPLFRQLLAQMRERLRDRSGRSLSIGRTSPRRSFPLHRELFDAIAQAIREAARGKTLAILAIVEEDIIGTCRNERRACDYWPIASAPA